MIIGAAPAAAPAAKPAAAPAAAPALALDPSQEQGLGFWVKQTNIRGTT